MVNVAYVSLRPWLIEAHVVPNSLYLFWSGLFASFDGGRVTGSDLIRDKGHE
jgi:hypothetical protein